MRDEPQSITRYVCHYDQQQSEESQSIASLVQFACHNRDLWKKLERMHGCQGGVLKPTWLEIYDDANTHL